MACSGDCSIANNPVNSTNKIDGYFYNTAAVALARPSLYVWVVAALPSNSSHGSCDWWLHKLNPSNENVEVFCFFWNQWRVSKHSNCVCSMMRRTDCRSHNSDAVVRFDYKRHHTKMCSSFNERRRKHKKNEIMALKLKWSQQIDSSHKTQTKHRPDSWQTHT